MALSSSAFMDNLRQLFAECDTDQNGSLTRDEFSTLCAKIGLNSEAASETFERLDIDKNDRITFDEFAAGFNQYSKQATSPTPSSPTSRLSSPSSDNGLPPSPVPPAVPTRSNQKPSSLTPSPIAARSHRKSASPLGVMSLGSAGSSGSSGTGNNTNNHRSGSTRTTSANTVDSSDYSNNLDSQSLNSLTNNGQSNNNDMIVYSSDMLHNVHNSHSASNVYHDYLSDHGAGNSGQFGSFGNLSGGGGGGGSLNQVRNMQDLLECVQKLQSENQILTQIFFKDKREREEYISQLGEEFDQQVKEVEERANRRARDELETEKRRLREMMQTERETLQHHYQTIEKMSDVIKSTNGGLNGTIKGQNLLDGESIDKVKSKLEDTYMENKQLKRSLLDTKTDVAMIWKEMEKLKKQYEDKLSSAYERNNETRSECDHIKQQLTLMKDSNRKLQDASDVITNYITDKVEPVLKNVNNSDNDYDSNHLSINQSSKDGNSRRGSILSEYLNNDDNNDGGSDDSVGGFSKTAKRADKKNSKTFNGQQKLSSVSNREDIGKQQIETAKVLQTSVSSQQISPSGNKTPEVTQAKSSSNSIKNIGRHFFIGSRAQSDADIKEAAREAEAKRLEEQAKSVSLDQALSDEPVVEPADGPSKATFNIILVGDSFVGKSSFAARFMEGNFVQGLISNCSIDFKTKTYKVDGVNYTVNLWDTA